MMAVSNTEILEKGTERDGERVILAEKKLVEDVSFLCNNLSFANMTSKVRVQKMWKQNRISSISG